VRAARNVRGHDVYALIEAGRLGEGHGSTSIFDFETVLAEARAKRSGWGVGARFERSDRPEEERTIDLFRSVRPASDNSILGTTRWTTYTGQLSRSFRVRTFQIEPLIEVARQTAKPNEEPAILEPNNLYGSRKLWSFSAAMRVNAGTWHTRMGRYGVALPSQHH
jgi:hypothetical protein